MTQKAVRLIDVLAPPGNHWLIELSRRKTDLPAGVHIVRFSDADDDTAEAGEDAGTRAKPRKAKAA